MPFNDYDDDYGYYGYQRGACEICGYRTWSDTSIFLCSAWCEAIWKRRERGEEEDTYEDEEAA